MLKRVTLIKGVGAYANCSPGRIEFRKTSLIFGYNSYGKSTLCELLRSLETGDMDLVRGRETIPGPTDQLATLTFAEDGKAEVPLSLQDGRWNPSEPAPFRVQVFDSAFVSRNLYGATSPERTNREAFSRFVLGEQGVRQANDIAEKRKRLADAKAQQKRLRAQLQDVGDVDAFVDLEVKEAAEALDSELATALISRDQTGRQLKDLQTIQDRPVLNEPATPTGTPLMLERLNAALQHNLTNTHVAAQARLETHIAQHMREPRTSQSWLREGLRQVLQSNCPFCEQDLTGNTGELIAVYREFFDAAFDRQAADLRSDLDAIERALSRWEGATDAAGLERNAFVLSQYSELVDDQTFGTLRLRFDQLSSAVEDAAAEYQRHLEPLRTIALAAIKRKRESLHESLAPIAFTEYQEAHAVLVAAVKRYREQVEALNTRLHAFKRDSNRPSLEREIERLNAKVILVQRKIKRTSSAKTCDAYIASRQVAKDLDAAIRDAEAKLVEEQSAYLGRFFGRINHYFSQFGSRDFAIEVDEKLDRQGYQPVLTLVVKYRGVLIDPRRLGQVFSESDRRALALSVFWAKLSVLSDSERALTIAVLDDPVTSFDDNRISTAVMMMRLDGAGLRQLLVFTHYHAFARYWLEVERVSGTMGFHKLTRTDTTSSLSDGDANEFLHSEQQKLYQRFMAFLEGRDQQPIAMDLRVYLENEIRDRYRHQLAAAGAQSMQLSEAIDHLRRTAAIGESVAAKAHAFREALNGPHHILITRGREDWASLAREMLRFIYEDL